jgi:signal transduction histidine kinase
MRRNVSVGYVVTGAVTLGLLVWLTIASPPALKDLLPGMLFGALIVFTDVFGVPLVGGVVSLLPMTTVAACLVIGPIPSGWAAFLGAVVHAELRYRWADRLQLPRMTKIWDVVTIGAANAMAHTASVLVGGAIYRLLGGEIPLVALSVSDALPLASFALTYLFVNHLAFVPAFAARGRETLRHYVRSLPNLVFYEGSPLVLAPLMALIYTRLGVVLFVIFALSVVVASLITRSLAQTSQRLQRRVNELRGLQAVGQALSSSLDIEAVVLAIYDQVARLMPARNFYVSLYDSRVDEVSFPLAVERGERVRWRSRHTGSGLTEYVLQSGNPLLLRGDVEARLTDLGVESIGRLAECWLGVPILAADEVLGVIAVQSYDTADAYDRSHQRVLTTIAAQAAVAIQNARLYARTDEALALRVQELDSILRTAREGILLLDRDWRVVAANRAAASLLHIAQLELSGRNLDTPGEDGDQPLIELLGYDVEALESDCQELAMREADGESVKQAIVTLEASGRHVERTLAPVRSQEEVITGWLLVLRDVTEEIELGRLKDDMTDMLVHDLRSPLTVLDNSFLLMQDAFVDNDAELFSTLAEMAQRSSDRMLGLVNDLLDVSELESGELELSFDAIEPLTLLEETAAQIAPLADSADISIRVSAPASLPLLHVDVGLTRRVLNNLVDNAVKFAPSGSRIRLWGRSDPEYGPDHLLLGVSDEGPGIPQEEQEKLFEKFHRVSSVRGRRSGSGLGLSFCKLAIEAHGGSIWVESPSAEVGSPESGSTFLLTLPVASASG